MIREFVPHEQALALKELGFNEECIASYDNKGNFKDPFDYNSEETDGYVTNSSLKDPKNFNASSNPTLLKDYLDNPFTTALLKQQAFRWFREEYGLDGVSFYNYTGYMWNIVDVKNSNVTKNVTIQEDDMQQYSSKEEAELACLKKLIEIVKNK